MSPSALRSLLLAGRLSVSTQSTVTTAAKAAPSGVLLLLACWFWLAGVFAVAVLALAFGADLRLLAGATSLALAPSLTGFILSPRFGRRTADAAFVLVWLIAATGLAAGSGGAASPLAAALLIAPAAALVLGRPWAPEAGAAAALGFAVAAGLGRSQEALPLGVFPQALAVVAIAFAAGLMALGRTGRPSREQVMSHRIAEVSHELRTPLTHILGFAEMIERQLFGEIGTRYVEYAGLIRKSGSHLLALVNDLLDLSRIEAGRYDLALEEFDARDVVQEVVRLSVDAADKKQIVLGMVTPEASLPVRADARAMRRMLINTVGNAIKFTPEGGRVMVTAAAAENVLVLETIDTGPGIPKEDREKLGHAYERGAGGARAEGVGLGLSLVRALATLHGGEITFHDAPGGGALVRIVLPVLKRD